MGNFLYSCLRVKGNYANIGYKLNILLATAVSNRCERSQLKQFWLRNFRGSELSPVSSAQCISKCQHVPPSQEGELTKIDGGKGATHFFS